ncbi:MAG: proliferating cell nuclear antigen (pcna) [Methanosarcinaceae archaeon]|nr:proliferating cell nuclear antigen (pcna) [Methanosarcinaceae archaeon]NKQ39022.1 proliferating cell nuclear antigen (pcna) [Methanosarcinales archaeon]
MFKAKIDATLLKDSIGALLVLVKEARFKTSSDGIQVNAVDPANIAMVSLDLTKDAFNKYEAENHEIGINLTRLQEILGMADRNSEIYMELDEDTQKLLISFGGFSYVLSLLDPSSIRSEPKIPQLDLPAIVVINGTDFEKTVKAAKMISDHVLLGVEDNLFYMEAKGDTDKVRHEMTKDKLIKIVPEDARSLFALEYLSDIAKPAAKSNEVTLYLGMDLPIKINFEIAQENGSIKYLLAPRVDMD